MAFGKNKDEVFQRITTVSDEPEKPVKKKKSKKEEEVQTAPVQDTGMWSSSAPETAKPQRYEPLAQPEQPAKEVDAPTAEDAESSGVRQVGTHSNDPRPELDYTATVSDEDVTGGLYSDSGRTVTMVLRLMSYLLFVCAPLYFIGKIFSLIGLEADQLTTGVAVSTVIDGVIGCVLLISAGFVVVAVIKMLQNLMATPKKRRKK